MRRVTILGATGSIGQSTLDIVNHSDDYDIVAVTAHGRVKELAREAKKAKAELAVIGDEKHYPELKELLKGTGIETAAGDNAIIEAAARNCDCVIVAILGIAALRSVEAALKQGIIVGLANKETLVAAGQLVMDLAKKYGSSIVPVDSEHSAIFQLLDREQRNALSSVILTASGGSFLHYKPQQLEHITPKEAVAHPNWDMGAKISVDSSTMMNKALELIEACHLFTLHEERVEVVIHPQSIVHSAVRYEDGSVLAHMGMPDMRTPISYALSYPCRMKTAVKPLDFTKNFSLDFMPPDEKRFRSLPLAREVYRLGNGASVAFNAANEIAVAAFLKGEIKFLHIVQLVEEVIHQWDNNHASSWDQVEAYDKEARQLASSLIDKIDKYQP